MPRLTRRPPTHIEARVIQPNGPRHHYGRYTYRSNPYANAPVSAPGRIATRVDTVLNKVMELYELALAFSETDFSGYDLTRWQQALLMEAGGALATELENAHANFDSATLRAFGESYTEVDIFRRR